MAGICYTYKQRIVRFKIIETYQLKVSNIIIKLPCQIMESLTVIIGSFYEDDLNHIVLSF
jgi:hypothetical protein